MIFSRGGQGEQCFAIGLSEYRCVNRCSDLSAICCLAISTSSSNISTASKRDFGCSIKGLKPSAASASITSRIFLISNCGPKFGFAVGGPQLVEHARLPRLPAIDGPGGILPDGKADLAAGIAERDFEIRFAFARGQFFLGGQQREEIGFLAVGQIGKRDDGK